MVFPVENSFGRVFEFAHFLTTSTWRLTRARTCSSMALYFPMRAFGQARQTVTFNSIVSAVGQVDISTTDRLASGKTDANAPSHFNLSGQPTAGVGSLKLMGLGTNAAEAMLNIPPAAYAMGTLRLHTPPTASYMFANGLIWSFQILSREPF